MILIVSLIDLGINKDNYGFLKIVNKITDTPINHLLQILAINLLIRSY